jgi:hypothetical protein
VAERISASGMINATIVNATEFVATKLYAAGISIDGNWAAHQDRFCSPLQSSLAVPSANSSGECIAACMGDATCAAVTFYAEPSAGVVHQCYRAEQCGAAARLSSVGAVVHEKPPVALLDMAAELNVAKEPPYARNPLSRSTRVLHLASIFPHQASLTCRECVTSLSRSC